MDFGPGAILAGKYRYERDLGAGGMGRVVVATHLVLRQEIAVKILTRTRSPDAARRFLREARLVFRLASPHVPKVLDAGQLDDGIPYIAMELLEGSTLATIAKERGALPVAEACGYVLQACAGIAEAHALGIVHRDVKLSNLFLAKTPSGSLVKVLDFGCAKAERTGESSVANATEDGAWLGTPQCMAPEQLVSSRDVDARADVWALGVVLYTLLAGRPPFDGKTLRILYDQIQNRPPSPIATPLPHGLEGVIERCLRKPPEARFPDARALAIALAPFAKSRPASRRAVYLAPAAVTLVGLGLCASVVVIASHRDTQPTTMATASAPFVTTASTTTATVSASAPPQTIASAHSRPVATAAVASEPPPPTFEQQRASGSIALGICNTEHIRECYTMTDDDCLTAVRKIYFDCLQASDRPACMGKKFDDRFKRIQSKNCADLGLHFE